MSMPNFTKFLFFIIVFSILSAVSAQDFSYYLVGKTAKISRKPKVAAFDGVTNFKTTRTLWNGAQKNGVGVVINFSGETILTKIEVDTARPNKHQWLPEKTEFYIWNSSKLNWNKPKTIFDVTGKGKEKDYRNALVKTIWTPSKEVKAKAVKILMYGENIWLCEIKLWAKGVDGKIRSLKPILPTSLKGLELLIPEEKNIASGSLRSPSVWKYNGIKGRWLAIGQPNTLNRQDKVTFRFNLMKYIGKGKVSKAILSYEQVPFGSKYRPEELNLVHFTRERLQISTKDTLSNHVELLKNYILDNRVTNPIITKVNVTDLVNSDLAKGHSSITFRVGSQSANKLGNPLQKAVGTTINNGTIKLYIQP